tara:strand:- start:92 stop:460 length:369 start_codon:yes stop_codon:yes gene_type:complete
MTLANLFKAQAIFVWLYAAMFWVAPQMAVQGPGWTLTANMVSFGQVLAIPLFGLGLFAWMAPSWVGDNINKVGMIFGVYINLALVAVQVFHVSTGAANFDPMAMIPALVLAALFFWKTRATN